jgi:hypothetical protein
MSSRPRIVQLWHQLYDILCAQPFNNQTFGHKYIDLLSAMATSLGYRTLTQTDIDKFYAPQAIGNQATISLETQKRMAAHTEGNTDPTTGWRLGLTRR